MEGADTLYRHNIFDFNHPRTITFFSQRTLQSRLDRIRIVHLGWKAKSFAHPESGLSWLRSTPKEDETWTKACQVLAGMKGLQELYIHIGGYWLDLEGKALENFLQPLCQIKPARVFYVVIARNPKPRERIDTDKPFRLLFKEEDEESAYQAAFIDFFERHPPY